MLPELIIPDPGEADGDTRYWYNIVVTGNPNTFVTPIVQLPFAVVIIQLPTLPPPLPLAKVNAPPPVKFD